MLKVLEEMLPIVVIPSGSPPFGLGPGIDLLGLLDGRGNEPSYERQVLRPVWVRTWL